MKKQNSKKGRVAGKVKGKADLVASRHLFEAIDLVRTDVAKVEFWANAVEQFSQPIPDYDSSKTKVWIPPEAGVALKRQTDEVGKPQPEDSSRNSREAHRAPKRRHR